MAGKFEDDGLSQYRDATEEDFAHLDRDFFETVTVCFTAAGYRLLRDLVNDTAIKSRPRRREVIRCFLGERGTTVGWASQSTFLSVLGILQRVRIGPRRRRILHCQSELTDGTFVLTTNVPHRKRVGYPFIDRLQLEGDLPCPQVVSLHREHVRDVLAGKPGVILMRFQSFDECHESAERCRRLRSGFGISRDFDYRAAWKEMLDEPSRKRSTPALPGRAN